MPQYIAVLDKNYVPIDLEKKLKACNYSIKELCNDERFKTSLYILFKI